MRLRRLRFSVRRIMTAIAAAAVSLAAFRYHAAVGTLVATTLALSLARTFGASDRDNTKGTPVTMRGSLARFLASLAIVSAIIGIALLPGLFLVRGFVTGDWRSTLELIQFAPAVILIGALVAIPIAYFLRRKFW